MRLSSLSGPDLNNLSLFFVILEPLLDILTCVLSISFNNRSDSVSLYCKLDI